MINGRVPDRLKCRPDRPLDKRGAGLLQLPDSRQDGLDVDHLDPLPSPPTSKSAGLHGQAPLAAQHG